MVKKSKFSLFSSNPGKLQGLDLVEINPKLGDGIEALQTAKTGMEIVEAMLGKPQQIPEEDLIPYNTKKKVEEQDMQKNQ